MRWLRVTPACALITLLAGCTSMAPRPTGTPPASPTPTPAAPHQTPAPPIVAPATPAPEVAAPATWKRLRDSLALDDCVAPAVARARRETRNPAHFEKQLARALPVIDYIQRVAAKDGVAGEFVLLPWVESHYRETAPRGHRPAGMWQIVSITARSLNLPTTRQYDGRLDKIAATGAVMQLLAGYYEKWHDWRLVDMAYNMGQYGLQRRLDAHGRPPAKPVIPDMRISRTTRNHLTRLLAIACVIRDPQRFDIDLPRLDPADRLEAVTLPAPARLRQVAKLAQMPLDRLRELNAGYRLSSVTARTPMQLLLPITAARSLREGIAAGQLHAEDGLANVGAPLTYTVVSGDSLWGIARRFDLHISQLRQWNQLQDSTLHPGQVLQLQPSPSS